MKRFKKAMKKLGRFVWEIFKMAFPTMIVYCCAGTLLTSLTMESDQITWDNKKLTWTIVCILGGAVYNAFLAYQQGGVGYEMLVSGNLKRMSSMGSESTYKISTHKEAKEYRVWKGFLIGAFISVFCFLTGIIFGCNQAAIDAHMADNTQTLSKGLATFVLLGFLFSGCSILPLYYLNGQGVYVSYFYSLLFALIPIIITGVMYIIGAYGRRNKALRMQELADRESEAQTIKAKKINYGGIPGTKPRKRK